MSAWKTCLFCRDYQCPPCLNCGKGEEEAKSYTARNNYYCDDCKGDHKQKQCKQCQRWRSLSCYPESTWRKLAESKHILHKHHWCTECIEAREKRRTSWQAILPQGNSSNVKIARSGKSQTCYPEATRTVEMKTRLIRNNYHPCTKCSNSNLLVLSQFNAIEYCGYIGVSRSCIADALTIGLVPANVGVSRNCIPDALTMGLVPAI